MTMLEIHDADLCVNMYMRIVWPRVWWCGDGDRADGQAVWPMRI